jgi:phage terminase Nu1 subunit (DNA packaging protein)
VTEPLSLRAFARSQGVSLPAVQRAIKAGRLTVASVGEDARGRPVILDAETAAAEWAAHTRVRVDSRKGNGGDAPSRLAEATLRERNARGDLFELEYARKKRLVVPAKEVDLRWSGLVVAARTKLLGLPSRAKGRLPHLTVADLGVLEALIREALEELTTETFGESL